VVCGESGANFRTSKVGAFLRAQGVPLHDRSRVVVLVRLVGLILMFCGSATTLRGPCDVHLVIFAFT